ncbi:MAG: hypothetical protein SFH39_15540 [Candidatus Magnetobacterium sp. LHC-1]|nr:hypothetical protein [Nitrospirota bacterium]
MVKGRQKDKAKGQSQEHTPAQGQLTPPAAEKQTSAKKPATKVSKRKKPTPAKPTPQDNVVIPPPVVVVSGVIRVAGGFDSGAADAAVAGATHCR